MIRGRPGRQDCVTAEVLSAYVDGRLTPHERAAVEEHAADCDDCREAIFNVSDITEAWRAEDVARRTRWAWYVCAGLAAVIVLAIGVRSPLFAPHREVDRAMSALVDAVGTARFSEARLSEPFAYGAVPSPVRGRPSDLPASIQRAALDLQSLAEAKPTADALRGAGVAHLAKGELDAAVESLTSAVRLTPSDAAAHTDLSAALLERFRKNGSASDAVNAMDQARLALTDRPADHAAAFNYALALEALHMKAQAIEAWQKVRDAEVGTPWADEADRHLGSLRQQGAAGRPEVPESANEGDYSDLARTRPDVLYARLDELLGAWARDRPAARAATGLAPSAVAMASALRTADRDRMRSDLVDAVQRSQTITADRRTCLAQAILAFPESRAAYQGSDYRGARAIALRGAADARCADISDSALLALGAYSDYWVDHRPAVADGLALVPDLAAHHYWFSLARMHYIAGLGAVFEARLSDAFANYRRASDIGLLAGDPDLTATTYALVAEAYRNAGDLDNAWTSHVKAFDYLPTVSERPLHIVLEGGAVTALKARNDAVALVLAQLLVAKDAASHVTTAPVSARVQLANALDAVGRHADAITAINEARDLLKQGEFKGDITSLQAQVAVAAGTILLPTEPKAAADALTEGLEGLKAITNQIRVPPLLLLRARAERALGDLDGAKADLSEGLAIFEDQRASLRTDQLKTSRFDQVWDLYGDLIDLERPDAVATLDVAERARSRALLDSLNRTQSVTPLKGRGLHDWMPDHLTALVYASLNDRLLVWTVTREGVSLADRPVSSDRLQAMVSDFVADVRAGRSPANARALANAVLPDGLSAGQGRRLLFLPDGPLYQLPFGLLPSGPDGAPLIGTSVVSTAPSLTTMARAVTFAPDRTRKAVLIGYGEARPDDNLDALPHVKTEIADIAQMYSDHTLLAGSDASPARILRALGDADVIHFAGHAMADEAYPSQSRLLVAPDATGRDALTPEIIAATPLRPGAVVVLSACDTARGRIVRGEGAMSLARPFLQAGASAVVASLWPVRDADAHVVLSDWHKRAAAGASPAQALAETQRHFLSTPQSNTAFAFVVIGTDTRASNLRGDH